MNVLLAWLLLLAAPGDTSTAPAETSIRQGLSYLAAQQNEDGSWHSQRYPQNTGMASLATLAFLAVGHVPDHGGHGAATKKGIEFVVESAQTNGLLMRSSSHGPMYEHAFSTLLLAEAWGMVDLPGLKPALEKAVQLTVESQNTTGGWRYRPDSRDADLSVTVAQVMALRAAQNAGISVPEETVRKATEYIKGCATPDGGFAYMPGDIATVARTAMATLALQLSGETDAAAAATGLRYLRQHSSVDTVYPYYGRYYTAQVLFRQGGEAWEHWFATTRDWLIRHQNLDGSWDSEIDRTYGTALAVLVLAVPYQYLPIYQRWDSPSN